MMLVGQVLLCIFIILTNIFKDSRGIQESITLLKE